MSAEYELGRQIKRMKPAEIAVYIENAVNQIDHESVKTLEILLNQMLKK